MHPDWIMLGAIVTAAATVVLAVITGIYARQTGNLVTIGHQQIAQAAADRYAMQRPVVYPAGSVTTIFHEKDDSALYRTRPTAHGRETSRASDEEAAPATRASFEPWQGKWDERSVRVPVANGGAGTAFDLCGVLLGAAHDPAILSHRFTLWKDLPLPAADSRDAILARGMSMVSGTTRIKEHPLQPPPKPHPGDEMIAAIPRYTARLTLTYKDVFGRKHAALFDYSSQGRWENAVFLDDVEHDLADLDREARRPLPSDAATDALLKQLGGSSL